jgi:hypothetical protein
MNTAPLRRRWIAVSGLIIALAAQTSAHAATCAVPAPTAPAFAQGTSNTLGWSQPTGAAQGSRFTVEVSASDLRKTDGSFTSVEQSASVTGSARAKTFSGLAERRHYYHLRAEASSTCTAGAWSSIVSTTQDATPPVVTVASPEPVYVDEDVTITGTAVDTPTAPATAASGARDVLVVLDNQIAALGAMHDQPRDRVDVNGDGTWTATFSGLSLGIYSITTTATDKVGNTSPESATGNVIVIAAP